MEHLPCDYGRVVYSLSRKDAEDYCDYLISFMGSTDNLEGSYIVFGDSHNHCENLP